ncbi:MAG: DNA replication/repair protein RecF [Ignavibacteria bacterium]|nr:DNA replication/repair protein RecF [Ignavibacteria bacterium]
MYLHSLQLENFRLHKSSKINFSEGLNYLVGGNGQGKTSILEAIHYISTTKSFTSNHESEVVSFGCNGYEIRGRIVDLVEDIMTLRYSIDENKKTYILNGKIINQPSSIIGRYPIVLLSPQDTQITSGPPSERRKFVDSIISQKSSIYLQDLLNYKRILKQRASLLWQIKDNYSKDLIYELDAWTTKLVETGSKIIKSRIDFVEDFVPYLKSSYNMIMGEAENPNIIYQSIEFHSTDNLEEAFFQLLELERENEIRRAANLIGPHRDEFLFSINNISLKDYGSQGQHKTFQVALRFAEYFYLKDKMNKNPFFLLDDVFGDLDLNRSKKISEHLIEIGQAFITLTDFTNISELRKSQDDSIIIVKEGQMQYAS